MALNERDPLNISFGIVQNVQQLKPDDSTEQILDLVVKGERRLGRTPGGA